MKKLLVVLFSALLVISGCAQEKQESSSEEEVPVRLDVAIELPSDDIQLEQEVTIKAIVSQGDEMVEDADDVKFEIWKSGQDEHEMIDGNNVGGGEYNVSKSFTEEGTYYVIAHVTARKMHTMPKQEFVVGNPDPKEDTMMSEEHDGEMEGNKEHGDDTHVEMESQAVHGDTHENSLMIHHQIDDNMKATEPVTLRTHLQHNNMPLTDAKVRFEVWMNDEDMHEFIDATEGTEGEYTAENTFEQAGMYHVVVHVEKGDIHDHKEEMIEVK
ncbi:FixH family protein [Bacillus solimangrovi]|uniref:YtkA-like domain-containing protein n=1 Tax=Bacillus solimangrovi TaxID=1305675 RepID=A0A1E5LBT4_9BACI|nr:FixH family protein [Bacillus solimangrovi]OEH91555.1 hypothetical protein BFG57_04050 [Bacillus solimangrovi]